MKNYKFPVAFLFMLMLSFSISDSLSAQGLYKSKNGKVKFFSEAPLENIEATTEQATSVLNASTGEVAFSIPIKSFGFEKSLMQEHFNENYMESDKFPQATFAGKIEGKIDMQSIAEQTLTVKGKLTIHGVTQERSIPVTLKIEKDGISGASKFKVKVADHKIEIPTLVFQNIAEIIEVTLQVKYPNPAS